VYRNIFQHETTKSVEEIPYCTSASSHTISTVKLKMRHFPSLRLPI